MPNKLRRDKRGGTRKSATNVSKPFRSPDSVKEVLGRLTPTLTRVSDQAAPSDLLETVARATSARRADTRLSGVVERDDTLVIFAESAAWSARLRYVMQELEAQIKQAQPTIQHVSVRVMPKA